MLHTLPEPATDDETEPVEDEMVVGGFGAEGGLMGVCYLLNFKVLPV